jgi:hypothetical protein
VRAVIAPPPPLIFCVCIPDFIIRFTPCSYMDLLLWLYILYVFSSRKYITALPTACIDALSTSIKIIPRYQTIILKLLWGIAWYFYKGRLETKLSYGCTKVFKVMFASPMPYDGLYKAAYGFKWPHEIPSKLCTWCTIEVAHKYTVSKHLLGNICNFLTFFQEFPPKSVWNIAVLSLKFSPYQEKFLY